MKTASARRLSGIVWVKLKVPKEVHRKAKLRALEEDCTLEQFFVDAAASKALSQTIKSER